MLFYFGLNLSLVVDAEHRVLLFYNILRTKKLITCKKSQNCMSVFTRCVLLKLAELFLTSRLNPFHLPAYEW